MKRYSLTADPKMLNYQAGEHRYGRPARLYGVDQLAKSGPTAVVLCEGEWDRSRR